MSESFLLGAVLALAGGFLDAARTPPAAKTGAGV